LLSAEVIELLKELKLPTEDLLERPDRAIFHGIFEDHELRGVVAIEAHGNLGLLRSLAVKRQHQRNGFGQALVAHAIEVARKSGIEAVYLLTESSSHFFQGTGFSIVAREAAPSQIRETSQFSTLCPATSAVMRKEL
jgi:N-acetylglutamate synthase-like GNAT family acetyltransferase